MGRPQRYLNRFFALDAESVLVRSEELLEFTYGRPRKRKRIWRQDQRTKLNRVLHRLQLKKSIGKKSAESALIQSTAADLSNSFALNLIRHASVCCTPKNPKCSRCPLVSFCLGGIRRASKPHRDTLTAVDLCAGAGGLSSGFRREGFHIVLAVEKEKHAAQSYRINNPGVPVLEGDIRSLRAQELLKVLSLRKGRVTAVISGPPCQGFSVAGLHKPGARRNFLFQSIAKLASGLGAKIIAMENVPGLKNVRGRSFENRILKCFKRFRFKGHAFHVDASKFGVPQRRKRLIFMCARGRFQVDTSSLHPPRLAEEPSVARAFRNLPRASNGSQKARCNCGSMHNHRAMVHSKRVVAKIKKLKVGRSPISYRRLGLDLACTLIAGHRALPVHPRLHRTITVREAARLQTMSDNFIFLGPHAAQPLQVANIVPYRLARAIARSVRRLVIRQTP